MESEPGREYQVEEGGRGKVQVTVPEIEQPKPRLKYHRRRFQWPKRLMDIVLGSLALLLLFPVFVVISVVILCSDGWPIMFRQKRIGRNGELFYVWKFRTMVRNAEEVLRSRPDLWEEYRRTYKLADDPRIFKFGRFLRTSSLDELPQLFDVVAGKMSLVGPRPIVEPEIEKYGEQKAMYLAMKPGCAGLWQCMGRSKTTYDERVELDREYYENASPWLDIVILIRTLGAIASGDGAR